MSGNIFNRIMSLAYDFRNPHAYSIANILSKKEDYTQYENPKLIMECDELFKDRWNRNRQAFRPAFWANHFEITNFLASDTLNCGNILDFGCGTGNIDIELAKHGYVITGVDLSPKAIEIANLYKNDLSKDIQERLIFCCADIETVQFEQLFDVGIVLHVLEHIPDPDFVFKAFRRLLGEDGIVWVSVPYATFHDDPTHIHHFYSIEQFEDYLSPYGSVKNTFLDSTNNVLQAVVAL